MSKIALHSLLRVNDIKKELPKNHKKKHVSRPQTKPTAFFKPFLGRRGSKSWFEVVEGFVENW